MNTLYIVLASLLLIFILVYLRTKRAKSKIIHVVGDKCTGCQRCLKKCPHKVLSMADDETALCVTVKYPEKCTACRDCIAVCKFNALELVDRKQ